MENKKREVKDGDDDDQVEDEMKMEKFYALLRSFRDARDRRRRELQQELEKSQSNRKKMKTTKAEASFEWQDFTTEIHFRKPPSIFPKPIPCESTVTDKKGKKKEQQHHQQDHALDLKLAL